MPSRLALVMVEPGCRSQGKWPGLAWGGMACTSSAVILPSFCTAVTPTYLPLSSSSVAFFAVVTPTFEARWIFRSLPSRDLTDSTSPSSVVIVPRTRVGDCWAGAWAKAAVVTRSRSNRAKRFMGPPYTRQLTTLASGAFHAHNPFQEKERKIGTDHVFPSCRKTWSVPDYSIFAPERLMTSA